jgi:hypothetical protein
MHMWFEDHHHIHQAREEVAHLVLQSTAHDGEEVQSRGTVRRGAEEAGRLVGSSRPGQLSVQRSWRRGTRRLFSTAATSKHFVSR